MTSFNRIAGYVLLAAHFSWSEQSCSDNFGKLAHPNQWAQLKYVKKGQKKLTREQSSPYTRASRRLGSGLLRNGRSSLKLAIIPSTV
jgi:hypothetical protein